MRHHTLSVVRLTICVAIGLLDCESDGGSVTQKVVRVMVRVRVIVSVRVVVRVTVRVRVVVRVTE